MAKNDKKRPVDTVSDFFWKKIFCYFFVTYQGLTPCKKSKKSNERILRSGERTDERNYEGKFIGPTSKDGGSKNFGNRSI